MGLLNEKRDILNENSHMSEWCKFAAGQYSCVFLYFTFCCSSVGMLPAHP